MFRACWSCEVSEPSLPQTDEPGATFGTLWIAEEREEVTAP